MGQYDSDRRPGAEPQTPVEAPASKGAEAGSLTSVQIRRARKPQPRASGPAPSPANEQAAPKATAREPHQTGPASATGTAVARDPKPAAGTHKPEDLMSYWKRLRGNRPCPATSELDEQRLAAEWSNSILFRCRPGSTALEPDKTFGRPASQSALEHTPDLDRIELSPMMLQWLLSLANDVVRSRRPLEDTEAFPSIKRSVGYRAVALPLSEDGSVIDHVLCHVQPA